jgi:hypothetical protein
MLQKINVRLIAFMLLLAFFQKLGMELWLHHWLHEPQGVHALAPGDKDKASLQQSLVQCHCLDDTMMPLVQSDVYAYESPKRQSVCFFPTEYTSVLFVCREFPALRGPPSLFFL